MQFLVAAYVCPYYPNNHVVDAITGRNKRRGSTGLRYTPGIDDSGWISRSNSKGGKCCAVGTESNIDTLFCLISDCCLDDAAVGDVRGGYGNSDTTEVIPI